VVESYQVTNPVREDFRGAAHLIEQGYRHGDVVLVMPSFYNRPLDYYLKSGYVIESELSPSQAQQTVTALVLPKIYQEASGHDLWVIMPYESVFDQGRVIRTYMNTTLNLIGTWRLGGDMEMFRYHVPSFIPHGTVRVGGP